MGIQSPLAARRQISTPLGLSSGISGWYDGMYAAYSPEDAANLASSYTDLTGNGRNLTGAGTPPSHVPGSGWSFNSALSQYLATGIVPVNNQQWSMVVKFSNLTVLGVLAGMYQSGLSRFWINRQFAGSIQYSNGATLSIARSPTSGIAVVSGNLGYWNGVQETGAIPVGDGNAFTRDIYIGAAHLSITWLFSSVIISKIGIDNKVWTPGEVASIVSRM